MTETIANSTGSDISIGSWTLVDDTDEPISDTSSETSEIIEIEPETATQPPLEAVRKRSDGFLTFDEYLQEHLLEHDYDQEEKYQKLKRMYKNKMKRGFKKCKARCLGISILFTIILAVSAFATLCSTLSQTYEEKEVEAVMERPLRRENFVPFDKIVERVNRTIEEMKNATVKMKDMGPKNVTIEQKKCFPKFLGPLDPESMKKRDTCPFFLRRVPKSDKLNEVKDKPKPKPIVKTKWVVLKEFLLDTNLHALLSLVMTNIYVFTLFADIVKKPCKKCDEFKCKAKFLKDLENSDVEEVRKYLFQELPFYNAQFTKNSRKNAGKCPKLDSLSKPTTKRTNSVAGINQKKQVVKNLLFKSCPFFSESSICPVRLQNPEIGKSECERRFEELDRCQKKFDTLKLAQRNRIKLLKQKFKNEVAFIKDTEEESDARAEKINRTSQMFIRKLKNNREKYLLELKKVRELRQKLEGKKKNRKDVSVGSYSVSLPPIYDYAERFKEIKEKFENEAPQFKFQ